MGVQLIFVVETDKNCKSDWIYLKETLEYFYSFDQSNVKLEPVYMGGKTRYREKQREIRSLIKKYNGASETNESIVLYCFDCDEFDSKKEDFDFLEKVEDFCHKNGYKFVWFCKDIERVYLKEKVKDSDKKKKAAQFKAKKGIRMVNASDFLGKTFNNNKSNLFRVLDDLAPVLTRKK
ncbi:MAG: hypothetical protein Q4C49_08815 [Bacillota bacterium]|nr:hypothetical protein [Bacillota bacterium]